MWQKPFTLTFVLGKPNRTGLSLVYIRFFSRPTDILLPTAVRVNPANFTKKKAKAPVSKAEPNHAALNFILDKSIVEISARVLAATGSIDSDYLLGKVASTDRLYDFILDVEKRFKNKLSNSTIKQYGVVRRKIDEFEPDASFRSVSPDWMERLENSLRDTGIANNTINTNIKKLRALFARAVKAGLMTKSQYEEYKTPPYVQNMPVYLTEGEIGAFTKVVESCAPGPIKRAGYYFLLGCYSGLRISDLAAFTYAERVKDGLLILRAKKNGSIISLPLYPKLKATLECCREQTLSMSDQDMRDHVKTIAKLAGIKQDIKVHSARHSFAMLMLEKGLTVDEVAELLGDSKDVAKIYARIINKQLHRRVMEVNK